MLRGKDRNVGLQDFAPALSGENHYLRTGPTKQKVAAVQR